MLWPFLVWRLSRARAIHACLACIILATISRPAFIVLGMPAWRVLLLDTSHLDALASGGLVALLVRSEEGSFALVRPARLIALASVLWLGIVVAWRGAMIHIDPGFLIAGMTPTVVLFASCMVLVAHAPVKGIVSRFFRSTPMRWFGFYSYGIYVWHGLLLPQFDQWFPIGPTRQYTNSLLLLASVHALPAAAVSIAAAWASYWSIEAPFLRLKKYFG